MLHAFRFRLFACTSLRCCFLCIIIFICWTRSSTAIQANNENAALLPFTDINPDYWAYNTIAWAISEHIAVGFEDHTFRPNDNITEEQFIALLVRALGDTPDISSALLWSDKYVQLLSAKQYPISDKRQELITRSAAAELISSTQGVHYSNKFAVQFLLDHGLVKGETHASLAGFQGNSFLTRAEALQMVKNLLDHSEHPTLLMRPSEPSDPTLLHMPLLPVEQLYAVGNAKQVILVTALGYGSISVKIQTFEQTNGHWREKFPTEAGVIGTSGFTKQMMEGSEHSPEGVFTLGTAFGKYRNPGTKLPYRQTTANDYWVDDSDSPFYNTWQQGPNQGRWTSAEHLLRRDSLYDYAIALNYNPQDIPDKGSAIFFHVWKADDSGTAGCTAMAKSGLVEIMKWLDPAKHPILVQGTQGAVDKM